MAQPLAEGASTASAAARVLRFSDMVGGTTGGGSLPGACGGAGAPRSVRGAGSSLESAAFSTRA